MTLDRLPPRKPRPTFPRPAGLEEMAKQELLRLAPVLRRLPRHVDRVATLAERGDLRARVSLFSADEDVRVVTRLLNRAVLYGMLPGYALQRMLTGAPDKATYAVLEVVNPDRIRIRFDDDVEALLRDDALKGPNVKVLQRVAGPAK